MKRVNISKYVCTLTHNVWCLSAVPTVAMHCLSSRVADEPPTCGASYGKKTLCRPVTGSSTYWDRLFPSTRTRWLAGAAWPVKRMMREQQKKHMSNHHPWATCLVITCYVLPFKAQQQNSLWTLLLTCNVRVQWVTGRCYHTIVKVPP